MKGMEKMLLVVNPCSGQKKAKKHLADIVDVFNRSGMTVFTYITEGPGDGERAVARYAEEVDMVVSAGGDGTFNETISGVVKCGKELPIGYIPTGSTNDFASSLGLDPNPVKAARDIVEGTPRSFDVGSFGGRSFSYVASFGIFTRTSYTTPQPMKNALGHAAYILSGIQELSQIKSYPVKLELEDGTVIEDKFIYGGISNSTSVGGVLTLSKEMVDMADGVFEILLIRAPKKPGDITECLLSLQNHTYSSSMLTLLNARRVKITAPEDMDWTLDGEHEPGHAQIDVECLHNAIQVVCREKE